MIKKYTFEQVCNMPDLQSLSFEEKQVMYVLYNADGPLTEEEIFEGVRKLEEELKVN